MDDLTVSARVTDLRDWPEQRLHRVYGLLSRSLARKLDELTDPSSTEVTRLRTDCELFGMELVRRGAL